MGNQVSSRPHFSPLASHPSERRQLTGADTAHVDFHDAPALRAAHEALQRDMEHSLDDTHFRGGAKPEWLSALATLALCQRADAQGVSTRLIPARRSDALTTLADRLTPTGNAALMQTLHANADNPTFVKYLAQADRYCLAGHANTRAGFYAQAAEAYETAADAYSQMGCRQMRAAHAYTLAAEARTQAGDLQQAAETYKMAAGVYARTRQLELVVEAYSKAMLAYQQAGLHEPAAHISMLAAEVCLVDAEALAAADEDALAESAYDLAATAFKAAALIYRTAQLPEQAAHAETRAATTFTQLAEHEQAAEAYSRAQLHAHAAEAYRTAAQQYRLVAQNARAAQSYRLAAEHYMLDGQSARAATSYQLAAEVYRVVANAYRCNGEPARAQQADTRAADASVGATFNAQAPDATMIETINRGIAVRLTPDPPIDSFDVAGCRFDLCGREEHIGAHKFDPNAGVEWCAISKNEMATMFDLVTADTATQLILRRQHPVLGRPITFRDVLRGPDLQRQLQLLPELSAQPHGGGGSAPLMGGQMPPPADAANA